MSAFVAAIAVAVAGCGEAQHPTTSARVVSTAAAKTTRARTAHFSQTITGSFNGKSLGRGWMKGVVDGSRRRADVRYDLSFFAKVDKSSSPDLLKGRMVLDGDNAFWTNPTVAALLPTGRRWAEISAEDMSAGRGWGNFSAVDPSQPVDDFRAAIGRTELLGTETVNGAPTKHYRTQVDFLLYLSLIPRERRPAFMNGLAKVERVLSRTRFPGEAWIAPDGTIRRAKRTVEGRGAKLEVTTDLTAIGKPVRIRLPPRMRLLDVRKP